MSLARELAESMADGRIQSLPRLTAQASPAFARDLLAALYRLLDAEEDIRREEGHTWTVRERVAAAAVRAEISEAIADTRAWLSRVARRGGRGLSLALGCRGATPAVMAHGCAAPLPAVGPAPAISTGHATALPADPLLLVPQMQELPVASACQAPDIISNEGAP